ncbi:MAG: hypothetical protein CVV04_13055 [Firmicutes bacterium HGW-Firmicutes-9]|jgi:xylulokinase|nr:MAG: hypothetical protein CVV04_13055 [Firmicutes bacterium HGW-Firmicutes-9]
MSDYFMMQAQRTIYLPGTEGAILTFDVGTSALKTALFTPELELVALASVSYQARTQDGGVEMEPGDYLGAMKECVVSLGMPRKLQAIGITTQGETLIPVGKAGEALRRAIVWLDARAEQEAAQISRELDADTFYQTTGLPEINGALPLSKALWLKQREPDVFERTHQLLQLEDYIRLFLTGESTTHASLACSTGWLDIHTGDYWQTALDAAGIPRSLLPEILPSGAAVGKLTAQAARYLGLRAGTPVFTGAMDQTAAVLALATQENIAVETLGTAHVVAAVTDSPIFDPTKRVTIYRHALDGKYVCLPIGNTGGMALTWFLREFGMSGENYASLDRLAEMAAPGCNGVTFLPYLCGCVNPEPIHNARAGFFGAGLSSTRAEFARALLESAGYELKLFLELLREQGCSAERVCAIGGGAKSALWTQMRADISGRELIVPAVTEAASAGAALLAAWGAGVVPRGTYPAALIRERAVLQPNTDTAKAYARGYRRFYALFEALKSVYEKEGCF